MFSKFIRQISSSSSFFDLKKIRNFSAFSVEVERAFRCGNWTDYLDLEKQMTDYFQNSLQSRRWREGHLKTSFVYLLIDPRVSDNLPGQNKFMRTTDVWRQFLTSIFYVGKGKSSRPYSHLYNAMKLYNQDNNNDVQQNTVKNLSESKKIERIINIWESKKGVVCLHVFHNIIPADAYTREAAIIDSLGLQNLTNLKRGDYYGAPQSWTMRTRKHLGVCLLYRAMQIYLAEGESQLKPCDLK